MAIQFIPPNEIIKHLRTKMPVFANYVFGGADFDGIEDDSKIKTPSAFIMLGNNGTETLSIQTSLQQRIQHSFDIILYLDAKDIRKQAPEDLSVAFKNDLVKYLNGWKPSDEVYCNSAPLEFVGDQLHDTDVDRYARLYQFTQNADFDSSMDGEGMIGDLNDLPDFETLIGPMIIGDEDSPTVDLKISNRMGFLQRL